MRVKYRQSIFYKLDKAIENNMDNPWNIESFVLDSNEWLELYACMFNGGLFDGHYYYVPHNLPYMNSRQKEKWKTNPTYKGFKIEREEDCERG